MSAAPTLAETPLCDRPRLSLVFPVFDEQDNLGALLETALRTGSQLAGDFEIVVVDDGSRDGSAAILDTWRRAHPRIRTLRHSTNRGYGAALRSGLSSARGELVFFSDADLQFDLAELSKLLEHTDAFDIVAGYRSPRRDPWPRRLIAWTWGALVRALFDLPVRDIDCAFKVFHRRVLASIPLASLGAFINTEILVRARSAEFRIHQVPVSHRRRRHGRQSGARPRVILRALYELFSLQRELRHSPPRRTS
ncbi:MAG: glycosyltransferase family 2 protein [Proteobacteria bacterium]|nr:glycosyltransferase family 2 protein [Pseudomonadota bacterium]